MARTPLTRERVLAAALELIDDEGLDALTMRHLGQRLGRDPMALYRHAPHRSDLLDGVVELVLARLEVPSGSLTWQDQLRATAHEFRRIALDHPAVVPLLVTRPLATPLGLRPLGTLRPLEQILTLLIEAGFGTADALHVYRTYTGVLYGHIVNEMQEVVVDPDETDDLLRLGLHRLPLAEFPQLRSLASELAAYDGAQELDQSMTVFLAGLAAQLRPDAAPAVRS